MLNNLKIHHYILIHTGVLILLFFSLSAVGIVKVFPQNINLIQWDAGWYSSIVEKGYVFDADKQSNTGFFPLFPYIWKVTSLSNTGVSLLNLVFFYLGVCFVSKTVSNINKISVFFSLSLPSLFFMYVPYSEALFFFSASLYLYGNHKNHLALKIIALLLSSLVRPTVFFLLPAVLFSELFADSPISNKVKSVIVLPLTMLLSTVLSFYIIGLSSNNFFAYSDSQINNWEHHFSFPTFPLTTWRGYRIIWLDFLGLFLSVSAFISALSLLIKGIKLKLRLREDKNLLLSLSYLAMILIYILFFHPKENDTGLTSILSINRYVLCSPFLFYLLYYLYSNRFIKLGRVLAISLLISIVLIGFPYASITGLSYVKTLVFVLVLLLFIAFQVLPRYTNNKYLYIAVYIVNTSIQLYLFQSYLKGNWIG